MIEDGLICSASAATSVPNNNMESGGQRGGGTGAFQHCIDITRGQEERIPETASVVGTNIALRSFSL